MMDLTARHCRFFHRHLTCRALLFTEMITAEAIIRGDRSRLLAFSPEEHPLALQLGGCDPMRLAEAARIGEAFGYDEINLNVGCPSDRVQSGRFGACGMAEPELVARSVGAMREAVAIPVTVKCRIGVDEQDTEESLDRFADLMVGAGDHALYVHARKAWLKGLSPKENREVPPLDYDRVHRLAARLAPFPVMINGGIKSMKEVAEHLAVTSGVMMGRTAYHDPMILTLVDERVFGGPRRTVELRDIMDTMASYAESELRRGTRLNQITRHMLGLATARPGARTF